MKKILWVSLILFVVSWSLSCETEEVLNTNTYKIYEGNSYDLAYTISDNKIYRGNSYDLAYTISEDKIYKGNSYDLAYTIR